MKNFTKKQKMRFTLIAGLLFYSRLTSAQPSNDDCAGASNLTTDAACATIPGLLDVSATMSSQIPSCSNMMNTRDVWYSFEAATPQHQVKISNVSATNPSVGFHSYLLAVYDGSCGSLTEMDCEGGVEWVGLSPATDADVVVSNLTIGTTYYVQIVSDYSFDASFVPVTTGINFDICVSDPPPPPVNDECAGAIAVSGTTGVVTGNSTDALESLPNCTSSSANALDIWYKVTADFPGSITVSAPSISAVMQVFSGSCASLTPLACVDNVNNTAMYTISGVQANTTYYMRLYDYYQGEGPLNIQVTGSALPVTMDKLSGSLTSENIARLSWNTFSEQNNRGFEIQRSVDGLVYRSAGFVSSKANAGNSSEQINYVFSDREIVKGAVYYRLKQIDIDGKTIISNIVRLASKENYEFSVLAVPNPASNHLVINTYGIRGKEAKIYLADITGKNVMTISAVGSETILDITQLPTGMYIVKYLDEIRSQSLRVTKL